MRRYNLIKQSGNSPLKTLGIGAAGGLGVGALIDFILNNKDREAENYRWWKRPLIYALLGSIPGIHGIISNYSNSYSNTLHAPGLVPTFDSNLNKLDPLLLSSEELMAKSPTYRDNIVDAVVDMKLKSTYDDPMFITEKSLDDKFSEGIHKSAHLYKRALGWNVPNIPVNAMNNSIYNNQAGMLPGTVNNMTNTMNATQTLTGAPNVSPAQIAGTLYNAGVGYATGAIIGKTIGALCGISPQSYNTLKNMGMYAGMMNTMSNAINRY